MTHDGLSTIRSYRVCFTLERRIHKIDRWRIPLPYGVPLRGLGYAGAILATVLIIARLPAIGPLIGAIHPAIRLIVLPAGGAYLLCRLEIDGRHAHLALISATRMLLSPRRLISFRGANTRAAPVRLGAIACCPDEASGRLRHGIVRGPATVILRYPFEARVTSQTVHLSPRPGPARWRGKQITLAAETKVIIR
jgi:hypothetical protein